MKFTTLLIVGLSLLTAGCGMLDSGPKSFEATYRLTSDNQFAKASITLENATGNTEQFQDVDLPYELSFTAVEEQFLYISGQVDRDASITCELLLNGVVQEEATSDGEYVIATCSGRYRLP